MVNIYSEITQNFVAFNGAGKRYANKAVL